MIDDIQHAIEILEPKVSTMLILAAAERQSRLARDIGDKMKLEADAIQLLIDFARARL